MRAIITEKGNKIATTDIQVVPSKGTAIRLVNGNEYEVDRVVFVEGHHEGEIHNVITHIELQCKEV